MSNRLSTPATSNNNNNTATMSTTNAANGKEHSSSSLAIRDQLNEIDQLKNECLSFKCTYCMNDLSSVSIKCAQCNQFFLCLKCFSMAAEIGEHKKDHNYYIKSTLSFPLFDSEKLWTFKEELLLLQFIEQYGFGNWQEISKHLPNRSAEECANHYYAYYVYGNIGKSTFNKNWLKSTKEHVALKQGKSNHQNGATSSPPSQSATSLTKSTQHSNELTYTQHTASELSYLLPPLEMSIEEQRALGYMTLRDDYEREYQNDAEAVLSNLVINNNQLVYLSEQMSSKSNLNETINHETQAHDDEELCDFQMKLQLIKSYRERLIERERLRKIARQYGLLNNATSLINTYNKKMNVTFVHQTNQPSMYNSLLADGRRRKRAELNDREMTDLNEKLKKYAQFMSVAEYESLFDALRKQRQLLKRMQQLEYYREKHGLTTFKQIDELNKEKEKLKENRRLKKQEKRMKLENSRLSLTRNRHIFNESIGKHTNGKKSKQLNKKKKREKLKQEDEMAKKKPQRMQISRSCTTTPSKRLTRAAIGHSESPSKFMRSFNGRVNTNYNRTLSSKLNNDLYDDERDTDDQSNQAEEEENDDDDDDENDRTLNCNDDSDEQDEEEEDDDDDDDDDEDDEEDEEDNESLLTEDISENGQNDEEEDQAKSDEDEDDEDDDGYLYNLVEDVSSKKGKRNEKISIDQNEDENEEEENDEERIGDEDEENDYENGQLDDNDDGEEEEQEDASSERMDINESEEEDMSSAGAASSGGSAVNETDNIVRRLRRLNTRNGSPLKTKVQNGAFSTLLNTSKYNSNGANGLNKHSAATKTANKLKKKSLKTRQLSKSFREHSSPTKSSVAHHSSLIQYGSPNMKRVCAMPGYNLLTENEKKVFKQAFI